MIPLQGFYARLVAKYSYVQPATQTLYARILCSKGYFILDDGDPYPFSPVLFTSFKLQAVDIGASSSSSLRHLYMCGHSHRNFHPMAYSRTPNASLPNHLPFHSKRNRLFRLSTDAFHLFRRMLLRYCRSLPHYIVPKHCDDQLISDDQYLFYNFQIAGNHYNSLYSLALSVLALLAVTVIVACSCFDTENFLPWSIPRLAYTSKHNAKLTNQLKVLQKVYGKRQRISILR
ncbi:hypothetical protein BC829DRAFT_61128 [Chytridium lagenaria]|nr:hypothetical protein BC829DRAFT_61128 [Chytridium lagenaria]